MSKNTTVNAETSRKRKFVAPKNPFLLLGEGDERKLRLSVDVNDMFFRHPRDLTWVIEESISQNGKEAERVVAASLVGFNARDRVDTELLSGSSMDVVQRKYAQRLTTSLNELYELYTGDLVAIINALIDADVVKENWVSAKLAQLNKIQSAARQKLRE